MRVVVVEPAAAVLDLAEVKARVRAVGFSDDDDDLAALARAAEQHLAAPSGWLGRSIGMQTLELRAKDFSCIWDLPFRPVAEIMSVSYFDPAGVERTLDPARYELRDPQFRLKPGGYGQALPLLSSDDEAVRIRYRAGYAPDDVPEPLKLAMMLLVGHWYENREAATDKPISALPMAVEALATPYRVWC